VSHANLSTAVAAVWFIESYELLHADLFLSDLFAMSIANEHYSFQFNANPAALSVEFPSLYLAAMQILTKHCQILSYRYVKAIKYQL